MSRNRSRSGNRTEGGPSVNFSSVTASDSQEDQMRPSMHHYLHHHRHSKWKVVLFNQLLSLIAILINFSPHATASPAVKRGGVQLNGRLKQHGSGERCPELRHCTCKSNGRVLDITCEGISGRNLEDECSTLKAKEHTVRYFNIRNSNIPRLEDHIFMGMKITHLYIFSSKLQSLSPNSLSSQGNTLSHLVLTKNLLTDVPTKAINKLRELDHINLNDNQITHLKNGAFTGLSKVTRLSIYNNQIKLIDTNAFDGLTKDLIKLNLGKNRLEKIPHKALAGLAYLQHLEFSDNHISDIDAGSFEGMDSLDHLTLNNNQLTHLKAGMFEGLTSLKALYIDHNQIKTINKDAFKGLEINLEALTLHDNEIQEFPSLALRPIYKLETLHVDRNKISRIDEDAFRGFGEHIKYLWMQENSISNIPPTAFQDLHSLEWIKLYNNKLTTLHYELMEPVLDTLVHIDIHSNPLICDCELRWYRQWIDEEWNEIEDEWLKDTFCKDPTDDKNHLIKEVDLKHMYCKGEVRDKEGGGAKGLFNIYEFWALCLFLASSSRWGQVKMFH